MFADKNDRSSPGLGALLGRFLRGLHPYRLFERVGAAWSYLMGPWEASSFLPSGWLIHRSVRSGELPEVLEALGLRSGSWEELGECFDELGPLKELLAPEVGVDLDLLKSWKGVSAGKDEDSAFKELSAWQKVFWEQGLTWNDGADPNQEECHKTASASHTFSSADQTLTNDHEPYKVAPEKSGALPQPSSLGIISCILNVRAGGVLPGFQWKDEQSGDATVDNPSQSEFEIQHIRNKRLRFLQQNKTQEDVASDVKQEASEMEQSDNIVPKLPDPMHFSSPNQTDSTFNLDLSVSKSLEGQSKKMNDQCEQLSDISLIQEDALEFLEMNVKHRSCYPQPVVVQEVGKSDNLQHVCPSSPDKDQGYHSLEYWQCSPLPQNLTTVNSEAPVACDLDRESVLLALPTGLSACPDDQNNEDLDSDLQDEIPISSVTFCTNKHIGYILGTVVSDDDTSPSSSDEWEDEEEDNDDGFDSEGSMSSTDSENSVPEDVLWNSFCSADPYNLQNFTASLQTGVTSGGNSLSLETENQHQSDEELWPDSNADSDSESDCSADGQENLRLWNAFLKSDDPYNPLYFTAPVQTSDKKRQSSEIANTYSETVCRPLPSHKGTLDTLQAYGLQHLQFKETYNVEESANLRHKKVTFHEKVTIHYVCGEEERKGHWEELARDHCRFQRRIKETEFVIGHCLTPDHRQRAWERMQGPWSS
ncbi:unnamed protein product [Staurois parvus]|uniref:Protein phosphatase 1 regulatory subunit 15A/B C-terminal domain-containing protein n=1 Tax=Staurois parvus TaxID=386267 RepID=A0ABN9DGV1_9NEOB|nr:unnamed protein product [Staurois parvus]